MDIDFNSIDMNTFNSTNFIKALKESYDAVPYIQGDQAAKVMVADAIKSHKFSPADVLTFICSELGNPSVKLDEQKNSDCDGRAVISAEDSRIRVLVIPTDEELGIVRKTYELK